MKQKTKDNLIYLGVAGTIVAALSYYIFYTDKTMGRIPKIPGPILWGVLSTPGIIALILERFWEHRRRLSLWVISGVVALINVSVILSIFLSVEPARDSVECGDGSVSDGRVFRSRKNLSPPRTLTAEQPQS